MSQNLTILETIRALRVVYSAYRVIFINIVQSVSPKFAYIKKNIAKLFNQLTFEVFYLIQKERVHGYPTFFSRFLTIFDLSLVDNRLTRIMKFWIGYLFLKNLYCINDEDEEEDKFGIRSRFIPSKSILNDFLSHFGFFFFMMLVQALWICFTSAKQKQSKFWKQKVF